MALSDSIKALDVGGIVAVGGTTYRVVRIAANGNVTLSPLNPPRL